jgi:uncharacterized protein YgbK (DUF1537 family)
MVKLLILADDFTGALDTSVQFAKKGAVSSVIVTPEIDFSAVDANVRVLVVDTETRHLSCNDAGKIVSQITGQAVKAGIPYIYKKTDSALRGNVGAELAAVAKLAGGCIHFVPAFPEMGRTTIHGIQYVNGVPLAKSVFGEDPFEPTLISSVPDILRQGTSMPVTLVESQDAPESGSGIILYDAASQSDIKKIAVSLYNKKKLHVLAGCAGFASVLADLLPLSDTKAPPPVYPDRLLMLCGSVNPVSMLQMDHAEKLGIPRIHLPLRLLEDGIGTGDNLQKLTDDWIRTLEQKHILILDVNPPAISKSRPDVRKEERLKVADHLGLLLKRLLDDGVTATLLLTGGDTVLGVMRNLSVNSLEPLEELLPATVISRFRYQDSCYYCITKSGGFGRPDLILDLAKILHVDS